MRIMNHMGISNIKLSSDTIRKLQKLTGQKTGQKAVEAAINYFETEARQRRITEVLQQVSFKPKAHPNKART